MALLAPITDLVLLRKIRSGGFPFQFSGLHTQMPLCLDISVKFFVTGLRDVGALAERRSISPVEKDFRFTSRLQF
jgi:hypothetical protein